MNNIYHILPGVISFITSRFEIETMNGKHFKKTMHEDFRQIIRQATGATAIELIEVIQELWSGYGATA